MKYLVLSDTHSSKLFYDFAKGFDYSHFFGLIHCGDVYDDALYVHEISGLDLFAVHGNCCRQYYTPCAIIETKINIGGVPAVISHIPNNKYLKYPCKIFIYGHTHEWHISKRDDIVCFNPGHLKMPFDRAKRCSYGIITCFDGGEIMFSVKDALDNQTFIEKSFRF